MRLQGGGVIEKPSLEGKVGCVDNLGQCVIAGIQTAAVRKGVCLISVDSVIERARSHVADDAQVREREVRICPSERAAIGECHLSKFAGAVGIAHLMLEAECARDGVKPPGGSEGGRVSRDRRIEGRACHGERVADAD